jgi:hypothetical protein
VTDKLLTADARTTSAADFARSIGMRVRTKEQKLADWNNEVERYVQLILIGRTFDPFGNPAVAEAMRLIALREGDAEPTSDPLLNKRRAA